MILPSRVKSMSHQISPPHRCVSQRVPAYSSKLNVVGVYLYYGITECKHLVSKSAQHTPSYPPNCSLI